jgi:hypothetical protein
MRIADAVPHVRERARFDYELAVDSKRKNGSKKNCGSHLGFHEIDGAGFIFGGLLSRRLDLTTADHVCALWRLFALTGNMT